MKPGLAGFAGALALLLAACGSTAQVGRGGTLPPADESLGVDQSPSEGPSVAFGSAFPTPSEEGAPVEPAPLGSVPAVPTGQAATEPRGQATEPRGQPTEPRSQATERSGPSPTSSNTAGQTYRGITPESVKIGAWTIQGYDTFADSMGVDVATGNQRAQVQAVVDHINEHGGVAGRTLEVAFEEADIGRTLAEGAAAESQRACSAFTEDHQVFAVVTMIASPDVFPSCLAERDTPLISGGDVKDQHAFRRFHRYFYMPGEMNFTRVMRHYAEGLAGLGFFPADAVIGLVRADNPNEQRATEEGLKPALSKHGFSVDEEVAINTEAGDSGSSQYSNAVLRFRAEGVTHVLFGFEGSPLQFSQAAESQGYRPRYGFHSRNSPAALLQSTMPPEQLRRSMGVGWQPMNDVDERHDPGILNDKQATCLKIMEEAGEDMSVRATALVALWLCDVVFLLAEGLDASTTLSPAGLQTAIESFGRNYQSATTFGTHLAPNRLHDAATQVRDFAFLDDCSCFGYVSEARDAP